MMFLSDAQFAQIFQNRELFLPILWDGDDFHKSLKNIYDIYINCLFKAVENENKDIKNYVHSIQWICDYVLRAVNKYLHGFTYEAFDDIDYILYDYIGDHLKANDCVNNTNAEFFRVVDVNEHIICERSRIFHTPYTLRSRISTSRYSIAGYPSLYISSSLELCYMETHLISPKSSFTLAAKFQIENNIEYNVPHISILDLAIKPQDFIESYNQNSKALNKNRIVDTYYLQKTSVRELYLYWYPIIAACSFIRTNKNDPFAAEYIIPQLLMQWIRMYKNNNENTLTGIRYFSCASLEASNMGFNYVFPSSGNSLENLPYCPFLSEAFKLTKPRYILDYADIQSCEKALREDTDLKHVYEI